MRQSSKKHVVLVGAGGNIGSHAAAHLARMPEIGRVTLIDRDTYEKKNLRGQDITVSDIGKAKAIVQAQRLRRINPDLDVRAVVCDVENMPLGSLRCDVMLGALDSRRARQIVNERSWSLGIPFIDSGVQADGLLARVNVYVPGPERPCLECKWNDEDYNLIEQTYPCDNELDALPETNAPSSLGALAASLLTIECQKIVAGDMHRIAAGREVLMDVAHHQYYPSRIGVNADCKMPHHDEPPIGEVESASDGASVGELLAPPACNAAEQGSVGASLRVIGQTFVTALTCTSCGHRRSFLRVKASLRSAPHYKCKCGAPMVPVGFDSAADLYVSSLSSAALGRSLKSIGVRGGDIVSVRDPDQGMRFFEITANGRSS